MNNEANTRALFEQLLKENDFKFSVKGDESSDDNCIVEGEKSANLKINKLLSNASKKGSGKGRPDYIISKITNNPDLIIICECKAQTKFHESINLDKYGDYAVDGVLLYSSFLSKEYDVLSIAISGESKKDYKISTYLQLKGEIEPRNLKINDVYKFNDYINLYSKDEHKFNQDLSKLLDYSRLLNDHLHSLKIPEDKRSLLISGCLIALQDKAFCASYKLQDSKALISNLLNTIEIQLQNVTNSDLKNIIINYSFIKTSTNLSANNNLLREIITGIKDNIDNFIKTHKYYDTLGQFYIEFLRYANNDKGLGIVLTPPHITELFCEIGNVNKDSVVYDNCCGTGGFLISSLDMMVKDSLGDSNKEAHIKSQQLIGTEFQDHIFTLACSNMYIHGDGRSHIFKGSCFDNKIIEQVKALKPNVGFLNPPYKSSKNDIEELKFVLNNIECLEKGSLCIAIIPMSCAIADSKNKDVYDLKKELLKYHTLDAVFSMPDELFVNSNVNTRTCIMVFKAKEPHPENYKTYFGYWKNDCFIKRRDGRADYNNLWEDIKKHWVSSYRNRDEIINESVKKTVGANDEWCAEAYLETDYSNIPSNLFVSKLKNYCLYLFSNNLVNSINNNPLDISFVPDDNKEYGYFKIKDFFDVKSGGDKPKDCYYPAEGYYEVNSVENQVNNNGIKEKIYFDKVDKIYSNFISVVSIGDGGTSFYQPEKCACFTRVKSLIPNNKIKFNQYIAMYICVIIEMEKYKYGYGRVVSKDRLKELYLYLPVDKNKNPDWEYMEAFIKSLPYSSNL